MKNLLGLAGAGAVGAMGAQHVRYLRSRRKTIGDRQPLIYGKSAFHVLTFVEAEDPEELADRSRDYVSALESEGAQLIYAGRAAFVLPSSQIGVADWDAVLLTQHPSRDAYERAAASPGVVEARRNLGTTYTHGLVRPSVPNVLFPQLLLAVRGFDLLAGRRGSAPLQSVTAPTAAAVALDAERRIDTLRRMSGDALVVVNLIKHGDAEQRKANRDYGLTMLRRMAAGGHGPIHLGSAVTLEGDAGFDDVALVHYPGPDYFAELLSSEFFQNIIGDKQLGDTQAVPTVPMRELLDRQ